MLHPPQPFHSGAAADTALRQLHLALVDDDAEFRAAVIAAVQLSTDIRVTAIAAGCAEGLLLLQQAPADVLLVASALPDGDGVDLIREAARLWPGCAVMVGATLGEREDLLECIEAGALGYLTKDSSPLQMADEIRCLGSGGSSINPLIAHRLLARAKRRTPVLSSYEVQALELLAHGFTADETARRMLVSRKTVLVFVRRIYARLQADAAGQR